MSNPFIFFSAPDMIRGDSVLLNAEETRHALKVLRLKIGTAVIIVDGIGNAYHGVISKAGRVKNVEVLHPLEPRNDVRGGVALRMPYV